MLFFTLGFVLGTISGILITIALVRETLEDMDR